MSAIYVGLMSGTSMDGIDAVVIRFEDRAVEILATHCEPYSQSLRRDLLHAIQLPLDVDQDPDGNLHRRVGDAFRDAAAAAIKSSGLVSPDIDAIGSHGQTLRHQPNASPPFSLQIGDADIIARATGIPTIANFRHADIVAGGQGAPLVPPFHHWLFAVAAAPKAVLNIGGIANITVLPGNADAVIGYDTGPGNGLMDAWIREHLDRAYDESGEWAAGGAVDSELLESMLADPYFLQAAPKSTGFEYFNLGWLQRFDLDSRSSVDVQATLCELTARSIANQLKHVAPSGGDLFVCGGGVHNAELMRRLARNLPETTVRTTAAVGLDPDWVEASAFAWLAMQHRKNLPGNLPSVTGASQKVILGELHSP